MIIWHLRDRGASARHLRQQRARAVTNGGGSAANNGGERGGYDGGGGGYDGDGASLYMCSARAAAFSALKPQRCRQVSTRHGEDSAPGAEGVQCEDAAQESATEKDAAHSVMGSDR